MTTPTSESIAAPDRAAAPDRGAAPAAPEGVERRQLDIKVTASPGFAPLLARHGVSLLVSTYDTGKLVILRASAQSLNLHFVRFPKAMGVAANRSRLAVGTGHCIQELVNIPALCPKLPQAGSLPTAHDACYVPRHTYVTGEVDVHEMAWGTDGLWFVNTRFSCLCTVDPLYSFAPRWRPPFIKSLRGDDACHLNGLALVDGRPGYVTAFSAKGEQAEGWRPERYTGGVVMDVASGQIIAAGLSMPHSPRFYGNQLWVLDSGRGSMAMVERSNGNVRAIAEFPGFTRGLDFAGNLAFVGLSQMRKKNLAAPEAFGGIALAERFSEEERFCGIVILDLATGKQEAFLRFDSGVSEIFAVQALHGIRFPEILEDDNPLVGTSYTLSPEALAQVAKA